MKYTFQYETEEDRDNLIAEHSDKAVIEEMNIVDGNFLVFSDNPEEDTKQVNYINIPQEDYDKLIAYLSRIAE